jgi:hypothetical protein
MIHIGGRYATQPTTRRKRSREATGLNASGERAAEREPEPSAVQRDFGRTDRQENDPYNNEPQNIHLELQPRINDPHTTNPERSARFSVQANHTNYACSDRYEKESAKWYARNKTRQAVRKINRRTGRSLTRTIALGFKRFTTAVPDRPQNIRFLLSLLIKEEPLKKISHCLILNPGVDQSNSSIQIHPETPNDL